MIPSYFMRAANYSSMNIFNENQVKEINKVTLDKEKFESDEELLEKYAREEYLMKKESEDIFYVIKE